MCCLTYPCLLLAGNSGPGFGAMKTSSSVNLKQKSPLHCTQNCCSLVNLKVCLPQHLPGSSWKQEWLRPNLPSPTTAIRGCSLSSAGVWGPAGQEGAHGGPGAGGVPHCLPCSPTLAGRLTILTSLLPPLPDCARPPPGTAARVH